MPTGTPTVRTVQVGTPQALGESAGRPWDSSFVRVPSPECRWLFTRHLAGNVQADTENHGRPDQAVLVYAACHYPAWRAELGRSDIGPGGFAENLTVDGLDESTVALGDLYAVGDARLRVTAPRFPCFKIGLRWSDPSLPTRVSKTGRTGWYCAVEREGMVVPNAPMILVERPWPLLTVALANDLCYGRSDDVDAAEAMGRCPVMPERWTRRVIAGADRTRREQRGEALAG